MKNTRILSYKKNYSTYIRFMMSWSQYVLLVFTFVYLCVYMVNNFYFQIDSDIAEQLVMSKQLADEGVLISRNYCYTTELRVLGYQLIFIPLFLFLQNWELVRIVGMIIHYVALLASLFYLCKQMGIVKYYGYIGSVLLCPFSEQYYEYFLLNINYIPYLCFSFLALAFVVYYLRTPYKKEFRVVSVIIISNVIALLTGMNGMRQMLITYVPIFLSLFAIWLRYRKVLDDVENTENVRIVLIFSSLNLAFNLMGYLINAKILSTLYTYSNYIIIAWRKFELFSMQAVIEGWFKNYGFRTSQLFSYMSIQNLLAIFFVTFMIGSIFGLVLEYFYNLKEGKAIEKSKFIEMFLGLYVSISAIISIILYCFTDMQYYARYDLFFQIIFLVYFYGYAKLNKKIKGIVLIGILCSAMLIYNDKVQQDDTLSLRHIAEEMVDKGYKSGFATFWQANVITELSNGEIEMWDWIDGTNPGDDVDTVNQFYAWGQTKEHKTRMPSDKVFVLLTEEQASSYSIVKNVPADYIIWDNRTDNKDVDKYVVYGFENCEQFQGFSIIESCEE